MRAPAEEARGRDRAGKALRERDFGEDEVFSPSGKTQYPVKGACPRSEVGRGQEHADPQTAAPHAEPGAESAAFLGGAR